MHKPHFSAHVLFSSSYISRWKSTPATSAATVAVHNPVVAAFHKQPKQPGRTNRQQQGGKQQWLTRLLAPTSTQVGVVVTCQTVRKLHCALVLWVWVRDMFFFFVYSLRLSTSTPHVALIVFGHAIITTFFKSSLRSVSCASFNPLRAPLTPSVGFREANDFPQITGEILTKSYMKTGYLSLICKQGF